MRAARPRQRAPARRRSGGGPQLLLAALYLPFCELLGEQAGPQQAHAHPPSRPARGRGAAPRRGRRRARARGAPAAARRHRRRHGAAVAQPVRGEPLPALDQRRPARARRHAPRARRAISRAAEPAFLDRPFEVLIAGCGTGQQAVQAALAYGPAGAGAGHRPLRRKPRLCGAHGGAVRRPQHRLRPGRPADPAPMPARSSPARFDVIECTGVLHHLAEPLAGWRALLGCLAADGRMLLGLYSAIARRSLAALRADPNLSRSRLQRRGAAHLPPGASRPAGRPGRRRPQAEPRLLHGKQFPRPCPQRQRAPPHAARDCAVPCPQRPRLPRLSAGAEAYSTGSGSAFPARPGRAPWSAGPSSRRPTRTPSTACTISGAHARDRGEAGPNPLVLRYRPFTSPQDSVACLECCPSKILNDGTAAAVRCRLLPGGACVRPPSPWDRRSLGCPPNPTRERTACVPLPWPKWPDAETRVRNRAAAGGVSRHVLWRACW